MKTKSSSSRAVAVAPAVASKFKGYLVPYKNYYDASIDEPLVR